MQVVAFLAEDLLVAGGFDGEMYLFQSQNYHWQLCQAIQGKLILISLERENVMGYLLHLTYVLGTLSHVTALHA